MVQAKVKHDNRFIRRATSISIISYLFFFTLASLTLRSDERLTGLILGMFYVIAPMCALTASLMASKHTESYKRLWRLLSAGMFLWLMGAITLSTYATLLGVTNVPSPSLADVFTVAYAPLVLGILLSLGRIRLPFDAQKKQLLVNITMAASAAFLLCYRFILVPIWFSSTSASFFEKLFTIAYPMFDWILLTSLMFASSRLFEKQVEGWLAFLLAAFTFSVLADIPIFVFGYQMNPLTLLFAGSAGILVTIAAVDEITGAFIGVRERTSSKILRSDTKKLTQSPLKTLLIPFATTMVIPIVWLSFSFNGYRQEIPILGVVSILILLLLIYRNHLLLSENAILFAKTLRDSLTGLSNHRYFQEALCKTVAKAKRMNKKLSLIVIDIDNFTDVNKLYGHSVGDRILTTIANAITAELRENDEACRLSSDEFAVILPKTSSKLAYHRASEIRSSINRTISENFSHALVTVTMGISTFPTLAEDKETLLHTAEGALYWAKLNGKDQSLLFDPSVVEALSAEERARRVEEAALIDLVQSLAKAVDARDEYTQRHSKRVCSLAARLAKHMSLSPNEVKHIEIAGILHDVGKIGIPDSILNKPGRLTDEEMNVIQGHPALTVQILESTSLREFIPYVKAHHERWDGQGYPEGLKGEDIPLPSRILAIADTFDAMTTDRPYRRAMTINEALTEIERCSGSQFDPEIAEQFLAMFEYRHRKTNSADSNTGDFRDDQRVSPVSA